MKNQGDVIYVMQAGLLPYFKIGITRNPTSRMKELQTGCPLRIEVRHVQADGSRQIEQELHRKLKPWQTCGEWYTATTESVEILRQEFGLDLQIKSIDEIVITQRLDRHRLDLQDALDRTRTAMVTEGRKLQSIVEKAEAMMAILTDQEYVREAFATKESDRRASAAAATAGLPMTIDEFLARMFGAARATPRPNPIRPLPPPEPQQSRGRKRKT